jgi:transposase-like protein
MTRQTNGNTVEMVMELLIENGFDGFADVLQILLNEAMKIERDHVLGAAPYERCETRKGHANGYKPKTVDTRMGRITVDVPQVRGDVQFYPSSLEKGCRSERALKLAIAEMYVKGISTRRVNGVLEKLCGLEISSTQVSRAASLLDEELEKWRRRKLEEYPYLILDAHYEKVRKNGSIRSCAVFTAIGINGDGKREILGVSVSLSESEVHWRAFLKSLLDRGLHGVRFIVSDAHDGLKAALRALFNGVLWQRCQFHLQRNSQAYVPTKAMASQVTQDIRDIFNAPNGELAHIRLKYYVEKYAETAPELAEWMEENLPEGLTVFQLPQPHRKRLRTTNMLERLHEEMNRRTRVARLFPNEASLLRLVSAIVIEISEEWIAGKRYLNMNAENENADKNVNSNKKRNYRKNVA